MKRALIVDDRPENRYLLRAILQGDGYLIDEAADGAEALVKAAAITPDIIVSDLMMPVMDGYTLLRHWKADPSLREIPFVVYTATYTSPKDERLAMELGADAFILKPTEPPEFMRRIEQVLRQRDTTRPAAGPRAPEKESLKLYNEVLVNKLEQKCNELEQRAAELVISDRRARRLAQFYAALSETNHAIVHACDAESICRTVCRIAVDRGGFDLAWVGMLDEARQEIRPVAWSGVAEEWFHRVGPFRFDGARTTPVEIAVGEGRTYLCNDLLSDPAIARVHESLRREGLHSALSCPLRVNGAVVGALTLFSAERDYFDETVCALFTEMADDVSFALNKLHNDARAREIAEQLRVSEEANRLNTRAVESSPNAIMITRIDGHSNPLIYVNPAFERITGYAAAEVVDRDPKFLLGNERGQMGMPELLSAIRERRETRVTLHNFRKDGTPFWNELSIAPVYDAKGGASHFVAVINEVTDRVQYEQQLERQANEDLLTGLASRNLLQGRTGQALAIAGRNDRTAALLFMDLDDIKRINDSLGHAAGDEILCEVARRLRETVRDCDTPSRLGGDEFVVLLPDLEDPQDAGSLAEQIRQAISMPMTIAGRDMRITASMGASVFPQDGSDFETLLRNADAAMYRAKEGGRNRFCFYATGMSEEAVRKLDMEVRLRHALARDELLLHFQPLYDPVARGTTDVEALLRWRMEGERLVSPADFIPLAESTGLIVPIGEWVLRTACRQAQAWRELGHELRIAVNLSARQFRDSNLASVVADALRESGLPPRLLKLEITESTVMQDATEAARILDELKSLGVGISVDDFGTGYSSLAYLRRFPLDQLKIDRSFIMEVTQHPDSAAIVHGIIRLAQSLRLQTVAEGVETAEQQAFLESAGCDLIQGYLYSRPLPADALTVFLTAAAVRG